MNSSTRGLALILALLAASIGPATRAPAAAAAAAVPSAAPEPTPVAVDAAAVFGMQEGVAAPELSPDGKRLAYIAPGGGPTTVLMALDLSTRQFSAVSRSDGKPMRLKHCGWSAPERLVCEEFGLVRNAPIGQAEVRNNGATNGPGSTLRSPVDAANGASSVSAVLAPFSRMSALDVQGKNLVALGRRDTALQLYLRQYDGQVIDWLDGEDGTVLMTRYYVPEMSTGRRTAQIEEGYGVDKLDTRSVTATVVERPRTDTLYISDGHGVVRLQTRQGAGPNGQLTGDDLHFYRKQGERDWRELGDRNMVPLAVDSTINAAYVLQKLNGHNALYRIALDGSRKADLVFENPSGDVDSVVTIGRSGRVIGARYVTDRVHVEYFGSAYRQLADTLAELVPRYPVIDFVSASADEQVLLVHASNGSDAGRYLVYDRDNSRLIDVLRARPDLENIVLSRQVPVQYKAADGTALSGYLTLPPNIQNAMGLPAIVVPHGGSGAYDTWGFNWLVNYFAFRGFAVLQPNYRGSAGRGDEWFVENGFKKWPQAVGDINAAARWLVSEGIADPARLAVAGWSFGGYVALQANAAAQSPFKAVVAIAPVTDLAAFGFQRRGVNTERLRSQYIGTGPHVEAGSPARHVADFKAPVLLFHGDLDLDVDVYQSVDLNRAMRKAGKPGDLVVYPDLDHNLPDDDARADLLRRSYDFLRTSLQLK